MQKPKIAKVIAKQISVSCPWLAHHTVLYRGREYIFTTQLYEQLDSFEVGKSYHAMTYESDGISGGIGISLYGSAIEVTK